MKHALSSLPQLLLPWFAQNKRDLPWRKDKDPYHIWVSEIMLQQTRVEAVKSYYTRFLATLPTVEALAQCPDDTLNKLWEGLGYYSRVRNMKKAACRIVAEHGGVFPANHKAILSLPGIGAYTAGAICSIAFNMPTPAVDGNVLRVMSRLYNDSRPIDSPEVKKEYSTLLESIYPAQAGDFTQALMELGATVCGPNRAPQCESCPCCSVCEANNAGTAESLPVKTPKKERRTENLTVFILCCNGRYAIEKRGDTGLLAQMWQFPNINGTLNHEQALNTVESWGMTPTDIHKIIHRRHIFTHITWEMQGVYLDVKECSDKFTWQSARQIDASIALPTAFRQFWEEDEHV